MQIKKIFLFVSLLLMITFANSLFAQEAQNDKENYFNFGLAGLVAVSDGGVSPGAGVAVSWNNPRLFTNWLGIGTHLNLLLPVVSNEDGIEFGIVASVLVGPSIIAFERGAFSLPVTLGYHFDYVRALAEGDRWAINMGIGVCADAVFQLGRKWNIFGRVTAIYNFGAGGEFLLIPTIGTGFKF